jgi:branched-chain amino acid transport system permease protein
VALLATKAGLSFWIALPAGILLCMAAGHAIGSVCLRSKGHYFAIFTLAVGIIIHLVIQKWESLTHGHVGVIGIPGPGPIGPIAFDSGIARSYLALFFLALTVLVVSRLVRSPIGRTLMAVRESESLAAAVGVDVMAAKRMAFTISAALAGLAGGLFAGFIGFLGPESSNVEMTFNTLLYIMVGGLGSLSGPIAGTFIVYGLSQVLAVLQQYQMVIFGLALVLLILFMPTGLTGLWRSSIGRPAAAAVVRRRPAGGSVGGGGSLGAGGR